MSSGLSEQRQLLDGNQTSHRTTLPCLLPPACLDVSPTVAEPLPCPNVAYTCF